jgi:hypothetical protein
MDRDDVQPVVQILLKSAVRDHLPQVAIRRGNHANVHLERPLGSERLELALLQYPQELRLQRGAHRSDFVEEDRSSVRKRELSLLARRRAGECAPDVAEQLAFEEGFGNCRTVHFDQRHFALTAVIVNRTGDHLLARAGLARDENRALGAGDDFSRSNHFLHAAAATDDAVVVEFGVAFADEIPVFGPQALVIERAVDDDQQLVDVERLLQVIESPELHRLDRAFDRGVRRHHDHLRPLRRRNSRQLTNEIQSGQFRHQIVDDHQIERPLREQTLRFSRARRRDHIVPVASQRLRQRIQDLCFVIDEEDKCVGHTSGARETPNSMRTSVP